VRTGRLRRTCLSGLLGLVVIAGIPACRSPVPTVGPDGQIVNAAPPRRFAFRPRFADREPRQFYPGGYAGFAYPRRIGEPIAPGPGN
jgi:hypothetical protein